MDLYPQNFRNPRQEGRRNFHGEILHQCIFLPVIGTLGCLLQLKHTSGNASPFVTDYITLLMFIIAFLVYFGFLTMEIVLNHGPSSDMGEFINNIAFLFGTLASILLVLILVRALGLVALFLWTIYVAWDVATKNSYRNAVCDVFNKVREKINGILGVQINAVELQPQPQRHIVVEIQEVEGQDVL